MLYGTPHAHPPDGPYFLTPKRVEQARASHEAMKWRCAEFGLDLRLGWELTATGILVGEPRDYVLEGTNAVLLELPGPWFAFGDVLGAAREQVAELRDAGLDVVLAHPERAEQIQADPELVLPLVEEGALVCFNADSFIGAHGAASERCAWHLLDLGVGDLVGSDAHGLYRPGRLSGALEAIASRYGQRRSASLANGSAVGVLTDEDPLRRAAGSAR